jgi:hypothetical protein
VEKIDYTKFNFGSRLQQYMDEVSHQGGTARSEASLTEGQKVFLNAIRRELLKYTNPNRPGFPRNQLEQTESFARTLGDLHNAFFDIGMHKVSDCLYNRWKMVHEDTKKLALAGGADQASWIDIIKIEQTDMAAFFDA